MKGGKKTVGQIYHEAVQQLKANYFQHTGVSGIYYATMMLFSSFYMAVFFVFYFVMIISMTSSSIGMMSGFFNGDYSSSAAWAFGPFLIMLVTFAVMMIVLTVAMILVMIATNTVRTSLQKSVLLLVRGDKLTWQAVWSDFKKNWKRYLGVSAWSILWTVLWSMLFFVPGVIKALSYSMAPYLVIEHPDLSVRQALKKSMEITEGHKGKLFLILLIQIGFSWAASVVASFGLFYAQVAAMIVWIYPLYFAMTTIAYVDLKQAAIEKGLFRESCEFVEPTPVVDYKSVDGMVDASHEAAQPVKVGVPAEQASDAGKFTGMEEDSPQL